METPSEAIRFKYNCRRDELKEAQRILDNEFSERSANPIFRPDILIAISLVVLIIDLLNPRRSELTIGIPYALPCEVVTVFGMACLVLRWFLFLRLRASPLHRFKDQVEFTISEEGLTSARPGATALLYWVLYRGVRETPRLFLLRTAPARAIVIPKRLFSSEEEVAQAKAMLLRLTTRTAIPYSNAFPVVANEN